MAADPASVGRKEASSSDKPDKNLAGHGGSKQEKLSQAPETQRRVKKQ